MPTMYGNTFNNYKENELFCHQNEGMLGRLASGAEHQNSPVKIAELQKHIPLISIFVLFQFFKHSVYSA
jgi:hypothetical protein